MTQYNTIAENKQHTVVSEYKAEIEARRQQYEYYRDRLLTFKRKQA